MKFNEMSREQHRALASKGGLAPKVKKPRRALCNKGHELTDDNVYIVRRKSYNDDHSKVYNYTSYRCKACTAEYGRRRRGL